MPTPAEQPGASSRARTSSSTRRGGAKPVTDPARRTAYDVLAAVRTRDAYANLLLAAALREAGLHGKDAALATELVYGTLRHRGSYDAIIGICADRGLREIDPAVLDVLRIGAHQLLGMRIKPHAAVATSVDIAIEVAGRRPAGFVNAVLRRIAPRDFDAWIAIAAPDRTADLIGHLAARYSHPRWIVSAVAEALGEDTAAGLSETEAVLAADADRPVVHLAAVPGLADTAELVAAGATAARWSPFGAYYGYGDPGAVDAVAQRRAGVQDEASQLAALALTCAATSGDVGSGGPRWLDLCAGPGGKARLLAALAERHGAKLIAADLHTHRAALAREALGRLGAARVVVADGLVPAWRSGSFDRVLADVPCSGLGSLRRRPEVRWRRSPDDIAALGDVQRRLLACAIDATGPGGVVGYVTCSPHIAETRQVLADVIGRRRVEVLDAPAVLSDVPELRCPEPYQKYAQFWPHRHGTDAIFIALLRMRG
jgi:16S rRNA (cytosine967-C5)-methyltransferase